MGHGGRGGRSAGRGGRGGGCGGRGRGGGAKANNIDNNWTPIDDIELDTPPPSIPFIQQPGPRTKN